MIIYGTKLIHLKTESLPLPCLNCAQERLINIYRNFFSFFFIPVLPLRKQAIISCPHCKKEQTKKEFLEEFVSNQKDAATMKDHLKSIIKQARVPLYAYATTVLAFTLIFGFFAWIYYEDHQASLMAASYVEKPTGNVLAVMKNEDGVYPYSIFYISHIRDQEAVVFEWKYSYASLKDARNDISTVKSSISDNQVKKHFMEPILASVESFPGEDFVYVLPLTIAALDLEQFQDEEES